MRFIPTRIHGFLDYGVGSFLIAMPRLLGFSGDGAKTWVPVVLGAGAIGYSLFTGYELGVIPALPMTAHLGLDISSGVVLALSPWMFGFAKEVWLPHAILGAFEIGAGLVTQTTPKPSVSRRSGRSS